MLSLGPKLIKEKQLFIKLNYFDSDSNFIVEK